MKEERKQALIMHLMRWVSMRQQGPAADPVSDPVMYLLICLILRQCNAKHQQLCIKVRSHPSCRNLKNNDTWLELFVYGQLYYHFDPLHLFVESKQWKNYQHLILTETETVIFLSAVTMKDRENIVLPIQEA